jgi:hypothetical protein
MALRHAASSRSSKRPGVGPPAFATRQSTVPKREMAEVTNRSQPSAVLRSAATANVSAPVSFARRAPVAAIFAWSRLQIATRAPSRANSSATA